MDDVNDLYRYVYESNNGYIIQKNHEHYGWYPELSDALYERDRLEECNWDLGEWVYMQDNKNKYESMKLPPRDLGLKRPRQYIYLNACGNWRIQKKIDGRLHQFGTFKTLDEAIKVRDELIRNEWVL